MDYQVISDGNGRVLAVMSYCTLTLAMEVARQYGRVLGVLTYRTTMHCHVPPAVGSRLPELVREVRP